MQKYSRHPNAIPNVSLKLCAFNTHPLTIRVPYCEWTIMNDSFYVSMGNYLTDREFYVHPNRRKRLDSDDPVSKLYRLGT